MTTTQLLIVCLTVLLLAGAWARTFHLASRMRIQERMRQGELATADKIRAAEVERRRAEERERRAAELPAPMAAVALDAGAMLAVHFDGRVVQGTLDECDDATLVLSDAKLVSGSTVQPLGGRQHIPRSRVVQLQELTG